MTNKELKEKIVYLEAELAEVKKMAVAMEKRADGGLFKPEDEEDYWFILGWGEVYESQWKNHLGDLRRCEIGNCFPTEQAAVDAVRVLKLIRRARESRDGFVPDWENREQYKYALYFNMGEVCIIKYTSGNIAPIFGFWEDESVCEQFIIANHDELIWFFTEYRR